MTRPTVRATVKSTPFGGQRFQRSPPTWIHVPAGAGRAGTALADCGAGHPFRWRVRHAPSDGDGRGLRIGKESEAGCSVERSRGMGQLQLRLRGATMVATVAASIMVIAVVASPVRAERSDVNAPTPGRTFAPVVERTVEGDLLFAGSSNLPATDVDGDTTRICAGRAVATSRRRICADNSSSTELSLPAGARVIAARLYVETTVAPSVRPLRVSLDGPGAGYSYRTLAATPTVSGAPAATDPAPAVPKLYEATAGAGRDAVLRQAVWDLTDYVTAAGAWDVHGCRHREPARHTLGAPRIVGHRRGLRA